MIQVFNKLILIVICLALSSCDFGLNDKTEPLPQGKILFTSGMTGIHQSVYSINPDGTGLLQVTSSNYSAYEPTWSPDGKRIAFVSDSLSSITGFPILLINANGSNIQILPIDPGTGSRLLYWGFQPDWSPDGDKITYIHTNGEAPGSAIFIATLSTGNLLQMKNDNNSIFDFRPTWSPDGSRIAFTSDRDHTNNDRTAIDTYIIDSDGTNLQRLTETGGASAFAWHPFGESLAFLDSQFSQRPPSRTIYLIGSDGSNLQQLSDTGEDVFGLAWDKDGKRIAYSINGEIRIVDVLSKKTEKVEVKGYTQSLKFIPVAWSPDERELLVLSRPRNVPPSSNRRYLDMIDIKNGTLRRLLPDDSIRAVEWFQEKL